ncbi:glycoside hydrolase family 43 protein [Hymenobacter sp. ASUV-10]|uniref:Glycoside hydrolase family 43 protein n=1 Tax=Hymenobacter aranciens TaxID=3063996 RepID=A0ABT9B566_9BACT|nr:glycoside hydrolase family 43 protein [Hymenobacter sp. ASUV-10]MDO7873303.1 glycoside hydrolase family 43 protein [Hymenobacter sp. ASUV-10]
MQQVWLVRLGKAALMAGLVSAAGACQEKSDPVVIVPPTTASTTTFQNPLQASGADPFVAQKDGYYYYLHTTYNDLRIWKTAKMSRLRATAGKVVWTPPAQGAASGNLWAPELFFLDGKWYLYYSAGPAGTDLGRQRTWVLENASADPTQGTWIDRGRIFSPVADYWAIDGTVLEQNGNRYFIWSGHNGIDAIQRLYISRMSNPWTLTGPRVELSHPEHAWENVGPPYVNEGPEILQRNGKTFLVYSASYCGTDQYVLGMLTASDTADPLNPASWTKSPQPVFGQSPANRAYATGHNSFFKSVDGQEDWLIYHANSNANEGCFDKRNTRMQKFGWNPDGTPNFGVPVAINTNILNPSGE